MRLAAAAWAPFAPEEPWDEAADACARWLTVRASQVGERPGVLTPVLQRYDIASIDNFGWRTSPRGSRDRVPKGVKGVLAYVPDWEQLEYAGQLARDGAIAAVETPDYPLEGWARWWGATDVRTGRASQPLPEEIITGIKRLRFYGNNGFTRGFGRDMALKVLDGPLRDVDRPVVWGALLAAGQSARGVRRLAETVRP